MSLADIVESCSNELGELNGNAVKLETDVLPKEYKTNLHPYQQPNIDYRRHHCEITRSLNGPSTGQSSTSVLDEQISPIDDNSLSSKSPDSAAPICRQFWKAGSYDEGLSSKSTIQNSGSYLHIHPKFLHSNATSHKWAFGALAELLDNAIDEIQNGATFVIVDQTTNAKDGRPALLIQDDGGGMDPEGMRRCLSFGFSDKKSKSAIGRYGNGFKTSSMRLGADAIVFSRHVKDRKLTQSIGLLSYTFLTRTGHNRIVVPMVDYELNPATGKLEMLNQSDEESFLSNLSILLEWSPYTTQEELLKQFDDIGYHGTKVIIYNLWCDDQGNIELDFDTDPEDIRLKEAAKDPEKKASRVANEQHIANQLHYSLRVYLSILYLQLPQTFSIMLRGQVVLYHNIATELKYPEFIMYKPAGSSEGILTSIGFIKEAPHVNIHGFNVYHKNRLILPFWHVVSFSDSRGRGVVGVLEANFIEPTHNKQDFEKTAVFQKLENRLKEMTWEYWDHHCRLLGYKQALKKPRVPLIVPAHATSHKGRLQPVVLNTSSFISPTAEAVPLEPHLKRKDGYLNEHEVSKRRAGAVNGIDTCIYQAVRSTVNVMENDEDAELLLENKKLRAQCMGYEKNEEELNSKVTLLRSTLEDMEQEYARMLVELQLLEKPKEENSAR